MNESLQPLLNLLTAKFPWLPTLLIWIGALHLFFNSLGKFLTPWLAAKISYIVEHSPSDDHFLERFLSCGFYRIVHFVFLLVGIPLPTRDDYEKAYQKKLAEGQLVVSNAQKIAEKIALLIFVPFLLLAGCATRTVPAGDGTIVTIRQFDPDRTATVLRTMLPPAVRIAVAKEPQVAPWILDAKVAVCALVDSGKVTPADLKAAVGSTGIKEIDTPESQALIESAFAIYSAAYSDAISKHLDATNMIPVLKGICDGLNDGLGESSTFYRTRPLREALRDSFGTSEIKTVWTFTTPVIDTNQ